jgi:hypothetical protein
MPKTPAATYVWVGNVVQIEDGTKDQFIYKGTVQVHIVDETKQRADMTLAYGILGVVRGLLKPARSTVFTCGSRTLVVFSPESLNDMVSMGDSGLSKIRVVDMYNFLIT